ncbi:hypothetical protein CDO09_08570 [Xanthomonas perforans]|nr:hypothetical protein CDO09_08570 [Xanthomonas perforans]
MLGGHHCLQWVVGALHLLQCNALRRLGWPGHLPDLANEFDEPLGAQPYAMKRYRPIGSRASRSL